MDTGDNYVTSSTFTIGELQGDGRRFVSETHVTEDQRYSYEYLCDPEVDPAFVLSERAKRIDSVLHSRYLAMQQVMGTSVPLTRYEFLSRFTPAERVAIRELSKVDAVVEDFLEMMNLSGNINLPLTHAALSYIASKGALTPQRAAEIGVE